MLSFHWKSEFARGVGLFGDYHLGGYRLFSWFSSMVGEQCSLPYYDFLLLSLIICVLNGMTRIFITAWTEVCGHMWNQKSWTPCLVWICGEYTDFHSTRWLQCHTHLYTKYISSLRHSYGFCMLQNSSSYQGINRKKPNISNGPIGERDKAGKKSKIMDTESNIWISNKSDIKIEDF